MEYTVLSLYFHHYCEILIFVLNQEYNRDIIFLLKCFEVYKRKTCWQATVHARHVNEQSHNHETDCDETS